jgi:asparagine synthase (glutamine-hydrolysing)
MCGICGLVGQADNQIIGAMLDRIAHRGPDDFGIYLSETRTQEVAGLGHRRLSIIDLSTAGHQPMSSTDGRIWLTYNGEIYNFLDLRRELESKGHRFRSSTDTEVVIAAYREWGERCVERLNGMFAFAIWDVEEEKLFLARDRLGIKPLYYAQTPKGFAFASEIKALLVIRELPREIDLSSLHQYLTFLWVPDPKTMFRGIYKLPPAHYLTYQRGRVEIAEYWDIRFNEEQDKDEKYWADLVLQKLGESVRAQMISDVPLGAFLSGGIDSSSIVALMSEGSKKAIHTYTIGFRGEDLAYDVIPDDVKYAREVGALFRTEYNEATLEPRVFELLPKLVWHMDEPIADPAIITSYLICRAARETLTVLLSGMGGDEVFAGYPRHLAVRLADLYNIVPSPISRSIVSSLPASWPGRFNAVFRNLHKLAKSAVLPFQDRYLGFGTYFTDNEKRSLYSRELREATADFDAYEQHRRYYGRVQDTHWINQMLYLDLKLFLPCLNLTYTDKTSMACSLEVRVPFLDHELVELAARIPAELKLRRFTRKYILKRALAPVLPQSIIHRKKAGFSAPLRAWLRRDFAPMVEQMLSPDRIKARGYFDPVEVRRLIDANNAGHEDNALKIFQLLTLELWHERFIENRD